MDMVNCPKCGKIFVRMSSPICEDCVKAEEEDFSKVRDFLEEYNHASLGEASEATGVSTKKIMKWIKDGRLETTTGMKGELRCASCGRPIKNGRFCDKCIVSINNGVSDMFKKKPTIGMHTMTDTKKDSLKKGK